MCVCVCYQFSTQHFVVAASMGSANGPADKPGGCSCDPSISICFRFRQACQVNPPSSIPLLLCFSSCLVVVVVVDCVCVCGWIVFYASIRSYLMRNSFLFSFSFFFVVKIHQQIQLRRTWSVCFAGHRQQETTPEGSGPIVDGRLCRTIEDNSFFFFIAATQLKREAIRRRNEEEEKYNQKRVLPCPPAVSGGVDSRQPTPYQ